MTRSLEGFQSMDWVWVLIALIGCDSCGDAAETERETPDPVPASEAEPASSESEPGSPLATLGVPVPDPHIGRVEAAQSANRAALELHRAGDFEGSREGFRAALDASPSYDAARFNLACAHARLADHASALSEVDTVLRRDFAGFVGKLDDEDLAETLATAEGQALRAGLEALGNHWNDAIAQGLPASSHGRAGVYLRALDRFFPVTAERVSEYVRIDMDGRRVAWIDAGWADAEIEADEAFAYEGVHEETFAPPIPVHSWTRLNQQAFSYGLEHQIDATGDRVRYAIGGASWSELRGRRLVDAHNQAEASGLAPNERLPDGFRLRGNSLVVPEGEPIELGRGHGTAKYHSFAMNEARTRIFIASERELEPAYEAFEVYMTRFSTEFVHVDLESREVSELGVGEGGYVFAHDDEAYVVGLEGSRRHATFEPNEYDLVPVQPLPPQ